MIVYAGSILLYIFWGLSPQMPIFAGEALFAIETLVISASIAIVTVLRTDDKKVIEQIKSFETPDTKEKVGATLQHYRKFITEIKEDAILTFIGSVLCLVLYILKGINLPLLPKSSPVSTQDLICMAILGTLINLIFAFLDCAVSFSRMLNLISYYKDVNQ